MATSVIVSYNFRCRKSVSSDNSVMTACYDLMTLQIPFEMLHGKHCCISSVIVSPRKFCQKRRIISAFILLELRSWPCVHHIGLWVGLTPKFFFRLIRPRICPHRTFKIRWTQLIHTEVGLYTYADLVLYQLKTQDLKKSRLVKKVPIDIRAYSENRTS